MHISCNSNGIFILHKHAYVDSQLRANECSVSPRIPLEQNFHFACLQSSLQLRPYLLRSMYHRLLIPRQPLFPLLGIRSNRPAKFCIRFFYDLTTDCLSSARLIGAPVDFRSFARQNLGPPSSDFPALDVYFAAWPCEIRGIGNLCHPVP